MEDSLKRYTTEEVEAYFRDNPEFLDTKRGYETLTGLILVKAHQQIYGTNAVLGFEVQGVKVADGEHTRPSLDELFKTGNLVDRDADVCVANKDPKGSWRINRIQVTRVEERALGESPFDRLLNLIRKKSLVQKDQYLQLAVLLDEDLDLDINELYSEVQLLKVPYGRVSLVCQAGVTAKPNTFVCYEVYPDFAKTRDISVSIGQVVSGKDRNSAKLSRTDGPVSLSNIDHNSSKKRQDRRGKKPLATLKQSDVIKCLHDHPELLDDKKMHELVVGWLFAQFFNEAEKDDLYIGFPLKPDWEKTSGGQVFLDVMLKRSDFLMEDRDVDIYVGRDETWQKCQVTRFLNPEISKKKRRLADLIAQKCQKASPDPSVALVISVESKPNITLDELENLPKIPFGQIFLIMKASQKRGHFNFCQLYPKPFIGSDRMISLPV